MCFSSDARCLEHFQMSPVFIQRLPPWAARQEACVLTVGPISPSDHRCDETAYNLAELGYYSHLVKRRREAQRLGHGAQPHSYYAARLGLEPRADPIPEPVVFPSQHALPNCSVSAGLSLRVSTGGCQYLPCKGLRRTESDAVHKKNIEVP